MERNIVEISVKNGYGSGFYKTISSDLKDIFPDVHSFSPTNLKYMRYYYEMYPEAGNRQHLVDDYEMSENRPQVGDDCATDQNNPQVGDDFEYKYVFSIPWGHNKAILDKCKGNPQKAIFYVKKTLENNWSRAVLLNFLDMDLFERQGKAVSNFSLTLPEDQSDLAQAITNDPIFP